MKRFLIFLCFLGLSSNLWAQDWASERLEESPRHLEWVKVQYGDREVRTLVAYPERADKAPVILMIHEIFGLTDWAQLMADQLAAEGYIVVAPDLLSGSAPNGGGTAELGSSSAARKAIGELPPDQITADLKACLEYGKKLPASDGKVAVAGFCWGGSQSFRFATNEKDLEVAFVFYGTAPEDKEALARISAPVYGFYAENDARVNATLEQTKEAMKNLRKHYQPWIFEGGGHGFMRAGIAPDASEGNKMAREAAWKEWKRLLKNL